MSEKCVTIFCPNKVSNTDIACYLYPVNNMLTLFKHACLMQLSHQGTAKRQS